MKILLLSLALSSLAPGGEWEKIFALQKGWTTSSVAEARGKNLRSDSTGPPNYLTNATSPKKAEYLRTIDHFPFLQAAEHHCPARPGECGP